VHEDEEHFLIQVSEAIDLGDAEALGEAVDDFSAFCFKQTPPAAEAPPCADDFVAELVRLMTTPAFLNAEDSSKLTVLLENDWGRLGPRQRLGVCRALERVYEQFTDEASQLVVAELLGEYLADAAGLAALDRLSVARGEAARVYVVQGYKCLVLYATDPATREAARARLDAMTRDASPVVQAEASAAIADVAK